MTKIIVAHGQQWLREKEYIVWSIPSVITMRIYITLTSDFSRKKPTEGRLELCIHQSIIFLAVTDGVTIRVAENLVTFDIWLANAFFQIAVPSESNTTVVPSYKNSLIWSNSEIWGKYFSVLPNVVSQCFSQSWNVPLKRKNNRKKREDVFIEWHLIVVQDNFVIGEGLLFPKQ